MFRYGMVFVVCGFLLLSGLGQPITAQEAQILTSGSALPTNGITFDASDQLFIATVGTSSITQLDPTTGEIIHQLGAEQGVAGPDDLAFGPDGSLYWTSLFTGAIGRRSPDGDVTTFAQLPPGVNPIAFSDDGRMVVGLCFLGDALYELDPLGITEPRLIGENYGGLNAFDFGPDGLLYSPRYFVGDVVKINVDTGELTVVADGFQQPAAVRFDREGNLYAIDDVTGELTQIDRATGEKTVVTVLTPGLDNFAFDSQNHLYVTSNRDGFVVEVLTDGTTRLVSPGGLTFPSGVAYVASEDGDTLYVGDIFSLKGIDPRTGELTTDVTLPAMSVAYDNGMLVVSSWFTNTVMVWDPASGQIVEAHENLAVPLNAIRFGDSLVVAELGTASISQLDAAGTRDILMADLAVPAGLLANDTDLWASDYATGTVWQIVAAGERLETPVAVATGLQGPEGLTMDLNGDLLVMETLAGRLSHIDLDTGDISTIAEGLEHTIQGASGPPISTLTGLAVNPSGVVYSTNEVERLVLSIALDDR